MAKKFLRVLVADDHALSLTGLIQVLRDHGGFCVLPPASSGIEAITIATKSKPDLAVLDYDMPGATGLDVLAEIRRWSPETKVCILTGATSVSLHRSILAAGADGLFTKSSDPQALCAGLLEVMENGVTVDPALKILAPTEAEILSRREIQVLNCIAEGLTNSGAGEKLGISAKTIESHRTSLMRKLGVHSTAGLLVRAVRDGLISP